MTDINCKIFGKIVDVNVLPTCDSAQMAFAHVETFNGRVEAIFFPEAYSRSKVLLEKSASLVLHGRKDVHGRKVQIVVEQTFQASLIDWLTSFNSKERFFLVGQALGNQKFTLSSDFRNALARAISRKVAIPENAFVAMDYHLDWIYAALYLDKHQVHGQIEIKRGKHDKFVRGQQEDVDLLVAFEENGMTHLIFVEAKGVTSWTAKQLISKSKRYVDIFDANSDWQRANVIPYLVLMSPEFSNVMKKEHKCHKEAEPPDWFFVNGSIPYLKLELPEARKLSLQFVTRCDADGKSPPPDSDGKRTYTHWKVADR